jgi:hypothetical protein
MKKENGFWCIIKNDGTLLKKKFISYSDMASYANQKYGQRNWTYQWVETKTTRNRRAK